MMRNRPQRMANIIRRVVGTKLQQLTPDAYLTLTDIEVSADLQHALIWVSTLSRELEIDSLEALLLEHREELQAELAAYVQTKFTPRIEFKIDTGTAHAERINDLLKDLESQ